MFLDKSFRSLQKLQKSLKLTYFFATGWGIAWVLTWLLLISTQQRTVGQPPAPDFGQLSFSQLPSASESGSINIPTDLKKQLNYDPSRQWQAGQSPATFLKLGDFQESFQLQDLSLKEIEQKTGRSLSNVPLSQFSLIKSQTLGSLAAGNPQLNQRRLKQVPLAQALLRKNGFNISRVGNQKIEQLLKRYPKLQNLSLNTLNLTQYQISDIPGLKDLSLGRLKNWANASIADIPGLALIPWSRLPNPPLASGGIARLDLALGEVEQPATRPISGSYQAGFAVPCTNNCAHIELGDNPIAAGKQWISGKSQQVKGGFGVLGALFNGQESTGRHPFGKAFKVAIWEIDEPTGTVTTAWFFRICKRGFIDLGCSPYGVGPIPGFVYQENDWIFLGI